MHLSTEEILEGHTADAVVEELSRNPGQVLWSPQAHLARSGKGIPLHVIDVERPTFALIGAGNLFVRLVPAAVDAIEEKMEIIEGRHIFDGQFTAFVFRGQLLSPSGYISGGPGVRPKNSQLSVLVRIAVCCHRGQFRRHHPDVQDEEGLWTLSWEDRKPSSDYLETNQGLREIASSSRRAPRAQTPCLPIRVQPDKQLKIQELCRQL